MRYSTIRIVHALCSSCFMFKQDRYFTETTQFYQRILQIELNYELIKLKKKIKVLNSKNAGLTWFFKMFSRFYVVYLIKFQAVYAL